MKKALLLTVSLLTTQAHGMSRQEALHNLTEKTRVLRNIKQVNGLYWFAAAPLIILGASCSHEFFEKFIGLSGVALAGQAGISIAEWIKGIDTRCYFRYLYNKKINSSGYLVDAFSQGKFVLDDQMFVALGLKAGFYEYELVELAKKAGRTALAHQLAATEYYA